MKRRDLIYLSVAIVILAVAGFLVLNRPGTGKKSAGKMVEVIAPIDDKYDPVMLAEITEGKLHRNFAVKVDLGTELGNPRPFGR